MPHTEPPDAPGSSEEGPGAPVLFPAAGNFNAVVPLSEIEAGAEVKPAPESRAPAPVLPPTLESPVILATAEERAHDEQEEATLVPARTAGTSPPFRSPSARRLSWPVMLTALALSLVAGAGAGVYLIKSVKPVEIQAPASMTEDASHEAAAAADTGGPQPTQVASESHPEARPQDEAGPDAVASAVEDEVKAEKTNRDLPAPKRVTAADAPPGRGEHAPDSAPAKVAVAERAPERPERKASHSTPVMPKPPETAGSRRATSAGESAPALRAPERSLPVSSPPASAKSKRVIQWP